MAVISLIHPSRGRAQRAHEVAMKWISSAGVDVEYILSVDIDDPELKEYRKLFSSLVINIGEHRSAIDAINTAAKASTGRIIIVMSDDFDCPDNWGYDLGEKTEYRVDWIAKTSDGIQKWIITLPIMDREYYNRFGYVYYPEYKHMFCDTEMTCVADLVNRKISLPIQFSHNHYSTGKTKKDAINERADKTWEQGEKLFIERYKNNFGLVNPPGNIQSPEYLNWIKGKI